MSISLLINVILLIATLVIFADKSTHSIFNLVMVILFSCILLYFFGLEYLSFIFLLLYIGAIIVLFLFVSMLLQIQLEYKITYFETPKMNYIFIFSLLIELGMNIININPHLITMIHKLSFEYKQKKLGFVQYWSAGSNTNLDISVYLGIYTQKVFFLYIILMMLLLSILICATLCMQKAEKNQTVLYYDLQNVKYIMIYITLCLAITCLIYIASLLATMKKINNEKRSSFECGFEPFKSAYSFSVLPFYMYAIIFLIFEIELPLGFPAIVYCGILDLHAFFALDLLFLLILITIDFEIKRGLLDQ